MADKNDGFFGGLKKLLFKENETVANNTEQIPSQTPAAEPEKKSESNPVLPPLASSFDTSVSPDEQMAKKAYQLIESINQPGVDFFEVWNAAEENGGVTGANIKAAFNALKFADKSLSKDKVLSSGRYYSDALQKALNDDVSKKQQEAARLQQEKQNSRTELSKTVEDLERKITEMKQLLTEKTTQLQQLDHTFEPKLEALNKTIETGKKTIGSVIQKIQYALSIVEKEL